MVYFPSSFSILNGESDLESSATTPLPAVRILHLIANKKECLNTLFALPSAKNNVSWF